ncbi:hypothetical protein [Kitasatospora sp. A2-31]|uniref:hypothetical protein n=1 Tax=Kitasatospora sp. A2-31 TaxID=2916414 RepID=UPI001EEBDE1F|nr:hypothetical protein [Kitasatospora sp. A2-31]MCG6497628.1 hypothetical protein [Kitasatospora sp. A2-31]
MTDDAFETEQHQVMDANLARLRQADPELDRIFRITFSQAHRDGLGTQLRQQLADYAGLTHRQGRLGDYHALFAGTD